MKKACISEAFLFEKPWRIHLSKVSTNKKVIRRKTDGLLTSQNGLNLDHASNPFLITSQPRVTKYILSNSFLFAQNNQLDTSNNQVVKPDQNY